MNTETNPMPSGILSGTFKTKDDVSLRYAILDGHKNSDKDSNDPSEFAHNKGTVIILQGRNEFIEKYFETMADLHKRGFTVATLDWRGQGGSQRLLRDPLRGYVRRFTDYTDDLVLFLNNIVAQNCPPPYYILAHSAGGLITLSSMRQLRAKISRIVLCAPLLGLNGRRSSDKRLRWISSALCWLGLGHFYASRRKKTASRPFENNPLTSDPQRFARNMEVSHNRPELSLGGPTLRWVNNVLKATLKLSQTNNDEDWPIPILIIAAGADAVVSTPATERFSAKTRNVSLLVIDGARHELLQEADFYRKQVLAAFDAFIPGTDS